MQTGNDVFEQHQRMDLVRTNGNELIQVCQDSDVWRSIVVNALAHDTQRRRFYNIRPN